MEGFLNYDFGGLYLEGFIHEGAYCRNFMVSLQCTCRLKIQHCFGHLQTLSRAFKCTTLL